MNDELTPSEIVAQAFSVCGTDRNCKRCPLKDHECYSCQEAFAQTLKDAVDVCWYTHRDQDGYCTICGNYLDPEAEYCDFCYADVKGQL